MLFFIKLRKMPDQGKSYSIYSLEIARPLISRQLDGTSVFDKQKNVVQTKSAL